MDSEDDFAREKLSCDYLKMKEPLDNNLVNHQAIDTLSENSESDGQFGDEIRENDLGFVAEVEDTSLDHYIPCFVKKIKGMKPFLIDIKVAEFPRNNTSNHANGGSFRDFRTKGGSFRDFNNSYSTSSTSSNYPSQPHFGINEGSFRDFNNSYSSTSSTSNYERQRDFGINGGSFRDFSNLYSRGENYDFGNNSHGGSWSFNPQELRSTQHHQVRDPNYRNNFRNNYGNNYRNSNGDNFRTSNGDNYQNSNGDNYRNSNGDNYRNSNGDNYRNNYGNNYRNNNGDNYRNNYGNNSYFTGNINYLQRNYYSNKTNKNSNNFTRNNFSNRNKEILVRGPRFKKLQENATISEEYNKKDFVVNYEKARFFMIKSFSENDVYNGVKYNVWSSTPYGNKKLDLVYRGNLRNEEGQSENCPIFLFFSVNSSGQFVGLAEMTGFVDFEKNMDFWQQDRWNGFFPIKWHIIKDIPNFKFRDITLENNENKVVTFSRDTQEIGLPQGIKMLQIFKDFEAETSLLDDFEFYEEKEKERWAHKNKASRSNNDDDLFNDLSLEFLEEEMRKMSFRSPKSYY